MMTTFRLAGRVLWAALLIGAGLIGPARADDTWTTTCEGDRCTARLTVADVATGKTFASVGLQVGPDGAEPGLLVFTPLGVAVKPGVRAVIDGRSFEVPFDVCYPDGCRAVAQLTAEDLEIWLTAESSSVQFFPFASDKPVAADIPLAGLRAALGDRLPPAP
jgi:invasion protein IalB